MCVLFAALVSTALWIYGGRSLGRRGPDSPALTAREASQADNTLVGMVGGIQEFRVEELRVPPDSLASVTRLQARIVGARDSGRLVADLALENGRWKMLSAAFTLSDGRTIPVVGSAGR